MAFKQWTKRIAATGAAVLLTAAMAMPAFAAPTATITSNENSSVNKTLTMAENGVTKPTATFTFTVSKDTSAENEGSAPEVNRSVNVATSALTANTEKALDNSKLVGDLFKDSDFASVDPGVYYYKLTETSSYTATEGTDSLKLDEPYYLAVKVTNDGSGNKIDGITATKDSTRNDDTKVAKVAFENKYARYGNSTTGDDTSKGLDISKQITKTGNTEGKEFTFKITFTRGSAANSALTTSATGDVYTDEACETKADSLTDDNGTYYFKLSNGGHQYFQVPAGTSYTVEELNTTTAYTVKGTQQDADHTTAGTDFTGATATGTVSDSLANNVAYNNEKTDTSVLTGIVNQYGAAIAVVAIAGAGLVTLTIRRKKNAAE